jgi:hypothetical protein
LAPQRRERAAIAKRALEADDRRGQAWCSRQAQSSLRVLIGISALWRMKIGARCSVPA